MEGPILLPVAAAVIVSDLPGDTCDRWSDREGLAVHRSPTGKANGVTLDLEGRPARGSKHDCMGAAAAEAMTARAEVRVVPRSPVRLPARGPDGSRLGDQFRIRRLIHLDGRPVVLQAGRDRDGSLVLRAEAGDDAAAEEGLRRLRFWTAVDDDLTPFVDRFKRDRLIGQSVRRTPWLRPGRQPMPFEVLASAICEQLITTERARAIRTAIVRRFGPRHDGLVDFPDAAILARCSAAELERCGLARSRSVALLRAAREVAEGRIDLIAPDGLEYGLRRLRAIPGIGPWTVSVVALHGHGDADALPAGDLAYRVLVGEVLAGRPRARVDEEQVIEFFKPYGGWRGVAGVHLLRTGSLAIRAATGLPPRAA